MSGGEVRTPVAYTAAAATYPLSNIAVVEAEIEKGHELRARTSPSRSRLKFEAELGSMMSALWRLFSMMIAASANAPTLSLA
jgi:hypothetical protein